MAADPSDRDASKSTPEGMARVSGLGRHREEAKGRRGEPGQRRAPYGLLDRRAAPRARETAARPPAFASGGTRRYEALPFAKGSPYASIKQSRRRTAQSVL